eukprot:363403-Chlamydomonas_euryale.AAC.22
MSGLGTYRPGWQYMEMEKQRQEAKNTERKIYPLTYLPAHLLTYQATCQATYLPTCLPACVPACLGCLLRINPNNTKIHIICDICVAGGVSAAAVAGVAATAAGGLGASGNAPGGHNAADRGCSLSATCRN